MNLALRKAMTRERFFRWAEAREGRYEFDGEHPVAMTGDTNDHGLLVANIVFELKNRFRGGSCRMLPAEGGGIATVGESVRHPDATVTCGPIGGRDRLIPDPVVVFEVVSQSNARTDRLDKMRGYHAVPSIRRYVLVEQTTPVLVSFMRQNDEAWTATSMSIGDTLFMPEIGIEIPVSGIFDGIEFGKADDAAPR